MTGVDVAAQKRSATGAPQMAANERGAHCALLALIGLGVLAELLLIYGVARPLSLLAFPEPIAVNAPLTALLGLTVEGLGSFLLVLSLALVLYGAAYLVALQCRGRQALSIALAFSALFALTLLFAYPAGARDIFTNIIDGRMRWLDGFNPMVQAPRVAARDPLFRAMTYWQDEPSYYGPFWYLLLWLPARSVGSGLVENLIAFRAITLPFLLGAAVLAARLTAAEDERRAVAAVVLVGWCPLLLWECAVNGHNDIVMAFFALFALERARQRQWLAVLPLLALSIMTKYVTVLLVPLVLLTALRQEGRGALRPLALGGAIATGLAIASLAPFWAGMATFRALISNGGDRFISSPATLLAAFLDGNRAIVYFTSEAAGEQVKLLTLAVFMAIYAVIALRLWRGKESSASASFYVLFFYLLLVSWWFWPWYVGWLVVLGGALVPRRSARLAMVFSASAMCGYVILGWQTLLLNFETNVPLPASMVLIVFLPALGYWLAGLPRPAWLLDLVGEAEPHARDVPALEPRRFARPRALAYNRDYNPRAESTGQGEAHGGRSDGQRSGDPGATAVTGGGGSD